MWGKKSSYETLFSNKKNLIFQFLQCHGGLLFFEQAHYFSPKLLRSLYFSMFESHVRYGCDIWGQRGNHNLNDIANLQPKMIRIINFKNKYTCGATFQRNKNYDTK